MIDLSGMETFGLCTGNGSGDVEQCDGNGNAAGATDTVGCLSEGNTAAGFCAALGNAPTIGVTA
jgi:hypothetical protein